MNLAFDGAGPAIMANESNSYYYFVGGPSDGLEIGPPAADYNKILMPVIEFVDNTVAGYAEYIMNRVMYDRERKKFKRVYHYAKSVKESKGGEIFPLKSKAGGLNDL